MQIPWTTAMTLWVPGEPVPQGSMSAIPLGRRRGGRFYPVCRPDGTPIVNMVQSNAVEHKAWRARVTSRAIAEWGGEALDEDVRVAAEFVFPWNSGDFGTGRNHDKLKPSAHWTKNTAPDVDKLLRALLDGLADANVYVNDGRVVDVSARKVYGERPGARAWVQTLPRCSYCGARTKIVMAYTDPQDWLHAKPMIASTCDSSCTEPSFH